MNLTMPSVVLVVATLNTAPGAQMVLDQGSVACRSKAALEAMRAAGGFDNLPEFLIGTACFRLSSSMSGQVKSIDESGALEIAPRHRRLMTQPPSLWIEEPVTPIS